MNLLFVHGANCDRRSWAEQLPALANSFRVIVLDLPGHGASDPPPDGMFSLKAFVDAVEATRREAGAERLVLIGHSMGTAVVASYAQLFPQYTTGIVLVDGTIFSGENRARFRQMIDTTAGGDGARESLIRRMFSRSTTPAIQERILSMMFSAADATQHNVLRVLTEESMPSEQPIDVPCFGIYGEHRFLPSSFNDRQHTQTLCRQFYSESIPDTGHFLMMERADTFNRLLTEFVSQNCR